MAIRPTQGNIFSLVSKGLALNLSKLASAQEHVATGKRILRPSDDAVGTARALSMRNRLGQIDRYRQSVVNTRPMLETSTSALEEVSNVLSEARELLVTGMSGTTNTVDREAMGQQVTLLLETLVDVANSKLGDRFLFAGTNTNRNPYTLSYKGGEGQVSYSGNEEVQRIAAGFGTEIPINVPGSQIFGSNRIESIDLSGLTGIEFGTSASEGKGFHDIYLRHDATLGTPGSGIALVNGGALDTILANHTLTVDAAANTVQLDGGVPIAIPTPGSPEFTDFTLLNERGAEVHLDFTGYLGVSSTASLFGGGSISLDGSTFTPLTYTETDLELIDEETGTVLHLDTSGLHRSGDELVSFSGATDIFGVLAGAAADLSNTRDLEPNRVIDRLELRYDELLRGLDQTLKGLGTLGARTDRLQSTDERLESTSVNLEGLLSQVEDADIAAVVLDMNKAEQTLQLAQATGSRLIQQSLLNFLR